MSFNELIQQNEVAVRPGFFFGVLAVMAIWEVIAPRRALTVSKAVRWANNLGLVFFNSIILRLLFPAAAAGMAAFAVAQGWGIFNYYDVSPVIAIVASIVAMDLIFHRKV